MLLFLRFALIMEAAFAMQATVGLHVLERDNHVMLVSNIQPFDIFLLSHTHLLCIFSSTRLGHSTESASV